MALTVSNMQSRVVTYETVVLLAKASTNRVRFDVSGPAGWTCNLQSRILTTYFKGS